ncbi:MAG: hypothetical protein IM606_09980 [Cytophagales bacterium]|jgi:hypothetical protein|nr:hypothetical protein [Cytophagales bacterium]
MTDYEKKLEAFKKNMETSVDHGIKMAAEFALDFLDRREKELNGDVSIRVMDPDSTVKTVKFRMPLR